MEDHPGLGGEVGEQTLLDGAEGRVLLLAHAQRAEVLAVQLDVACVETLLVRVRGGIGRPRGRELERAAHHHPDLGPGRPGPGREVSGQPGGEIEGTRLRVAACVDQRVREAAQHVVRRATPATQPLGHDGSQGGAEGFEAERHQGGGDDRERDVRRVGAADDQATAEHHHDVHDGNGEERAERDHDRRTPVVGPSRHTHGSLTAAVWWTSCRRRQGSSRSSGVRKTARCAQPSRITAWPRRRRARPRRGGSSRPRRADPASGTPS